ncbi:MAG: TRAP transporter small permease subunit [Proteobacteria bacterium]|nr:TRAP transporter small permease subunit [Pseudomonadota bacterium]
MRAILLIDRLDPWFARYLRVTGFVVRTAAIVVLGAMVAIYAVDIGRRILVSASFSWSQELAIILAMWLYFLTYALVAKEGDYIQVDALFRFLPARLRIAAGYLARLLLIFFFGLLAVYAWETMQFAGRFTTNTLDLPESIYYLPLLLGAADVALTELIYLVRQLAGRPDDRPGRAGLLT